MLHNNEDNNYENFLKLNKLLKNKKVKKIKFMIKRIKRSFLHFPIIHRKMQKYILIFSFFP